jgi:dipeptidase E
MGATLALVSSGEHGGRDGPLSARLGAQACIHTSAAGAHIKLYNPFIVEMKKIVLYSDQGSQNNERLNASLLSLVEQPNARIGYIPSCGDKERKYFQENCKYYQKLGFRDFFFFDLDDEFDPSKVDELLACHMIHLSAGDPLYFNKNIKRRNFGDKLRYFADQGGILVGVSGGSLQLTRTVALYKSFMEGLENVTHGDYLEYSGLNLVDFEFLPHYNRWNTDFINTVKAYSAKFACLIYACRDGDGIVVKDNEIEWIGSMIKIENGVEVSSPLR